MKGEDMSYNLNNVDKYVFIFTSFISMMDKLYLCFSEKRVKYTLIN